LTELPLTFTLVKQKPNTRMQYDVRGACLLVGGFQSETIKTIIYDNHYCSLLVMHIIHNPNTDIIINFDNIIVNRSNFFIILYKMVKCMLIYSIIA
jgi:hypothetical protein